VAGYKQVSAAVLFFGHRSLNFELADPANSYLPRPHSGHSSQPVLRTYGGDEVLELKEGAKFRLRCNPIRWAESPTHFLCS
jgi:hypothetical protein